MNTKSRYTFGLFLVATLLCVVLLSLVIIYFLNKTLIRLYFLTVMCIIVPMCSLIAMEGMRKYCWMKFNSWLVRWKFKVRSNLENEVRPMQIAIQQAAVHM